MKTSSKMLIFLLLFDAIIIIAHILWGQANDFYSLDKEKNLPATYSAIKFLLVGIGVWIAVIAAKSLKKNWTWLIFGAMFFYLAYDEYFEFHERIADLAADWKLSQLQWYDNFVFYWTLIFLPLIIGAIAFTVYFIKTQLTRFSAIKKYFTLGIICFVVVIILEIIGGHSYQSGIYYYLTLTEESFELIGSSLFLTGTLILYNKKIKSKIAN